MKDFSKFIINHKLTLREALKALNNLSDDALTLFVVDDDDKMIGTLTDGDIRRKLLENHSLEAEIIGIFNKNFKYLKTDNIDVEFIRNVKDKGIKLLPLLDNDFKIIGIYNLKNLKSILPIDAVLMAGGKGERLRPLTEKTPKPLLPIGGKPIINYNIDNLISYGINHISVTVNYLKDQIQSYFEEPVSGIKINCVTEPSYLGTIGSVKFVSKFYNDTVLVMNSDLFTNIDLEDFFFHFKENNADMSIAAVPHTVSIPYGIFEIEGTNIMGIKEKPSYNYYINAGIYLIKREKLDNIPDNEFFDATDFVNLLIKNGDKVVRFPLTGYWIDIGKHEDYIKAQEIVKHL